MSTHPYVIEPMPAEVADELRAAGGRRYVADAKPGFPCRACLRDAEIGEELLLVSHDPFDTDSPYRSASPVFIHLGPCPLAPDPDPTPDQMTRRQLSVRLFDADAMMIDATVIDGRDLDATLRAFFGNELADRVHIHNAQRGCWAATATRYERPDDHQPSMT